MIPYVVPANPDTGSINAAIASLGSAGGKVLLPPGVYSASPGKIVGAAPGVWLQGAGKGATIIRLTSLLQDYLIDAGSTNPGAPSSPCSYFGVSDLTLDMGAIDPVDDTPGAGSGAIFVGGNDSFVRNVEIINCGRYGIVCNNTSTARLTIQGNRVSRAVPSGTSSNIGIVVHAPSGSSSVINFGARILDNIVEGTPMTLMLYHSTVARNHVRGSMFGTNIGFDHNVNCTLNLISDNIGAYGVGTDYLGVVVSGFEIWSTSSHIVNNYALGNAGFGFAQAGSDCSLIACRSEANALGGFNFVNVAGQGAAARCFIDGCKTLNNGGPPLTIDPSLTSGSPIVIVGNNDLR